MVRGFSTKATYNLDSPKVEKGIMDAWEKNGEAGGGVDPVVVPGGGDGDGSSGGGRQEWGRGIEFVLACIGNAVGLGNIWRFPYLAYSSGGGAFLIPYFIMLILCGIPLLYMEISVGQSTHRGPVGALQKLCPFFQGAGMATVMLSFLLCTYYNVILTWALYYLGNCFQAVLPWATCGHVWNTPQCFDNYTANVSRPADSVSPSQEFYERRVLEQTDGIHDQGALRWELLLILLGAWALVYLCLWKGVKITGKVVYFTAIFPYFIIIILLVRGLTLPGADIGVDYFINPKWELLKEPTVWVNAAAQNFNSIGIAFGSMIALSSYNKRENKILKDVLCITILNSVTSVVCGFAIFSILGNIALNQEKNITDVVTEGPGLVFIVYPEAFATMPSPLGQILAGLFFFMLLCLAIDSQFANVEVVLTTLEDHFAKQIKQYLHRKEVLVLIVCIVAFLLAIPNVMQGGIYFFKLIDFYSSGVSLMLVAFFEVIAITWFYGARRLAKDVELMTGSRPFLFFIVCWYAISPLLILAIMIFSWVQYKPVTYGKYIFPEWAIGLGWGLACMSLICIPLGMAKSIIEARGSNIGKKFCNSLRAQADDQQTQYDETANMDSNPNVYIKSDIELVKRNALV